MSPKIKMCIDIVGDVVAQWHHLSCVLVYYQWFSTIEYCLESLLVTSSFLCKLDHIRLHILLPSFLVHLMFCYLRPPLNCSLCGRTDCSDITWMWYHGIFLQEPRIPADRRRRLLGLKPT